MEDESKSAKHFQPIPAEYSQIEEWANETNQTLMAIDKTIAEMPKDKGPAYELKPTWADDPPKLSREQKIANLLNSKRDVVTTFHRKMDEALIKAKPETAQSIKNTAYYIIDTGNQFKGTQQDKINAAKGNPKSLDASQNISLVDLYNKQIGLNGNDLKQFDPPKEMPKNLENGNISLAELYSNKYDITASTEDVNNNLDDVSSDFDKD